MERLAVRLTVSAIILTTVSFLYNPDAYGQSLKRVEGSVRDQSGGVLLGATVILVTDDRVWTRKTNSDGDFDFADFIGPVYYIEVYSRGFFPTRIAITDSTLQPVKVTLRVGEGSQCFPTTVPSAGYEERTGKAQLAGSVFDTSGSPLQDAKVALTRVGFDKHPATGEPSLVPASTNEKGDFQFEDLEPGRYSLTATREGFSTTSPVNFWIARKNLTRATQIRLIPEGGALFPCQFESLRSIAPDKPDSSPPPAKEVAPSPLPFKCPVASVCRQ